MRKYFDTFDNFAYLVQVTMPKDLIDGMSISVKVCQSNSLN